MKLLSNLRERLGLKLFLSYLVITLAGSIVLIGTAVFLAPIAMNRHIASMQAVIGHDPSLATDLRLNFNQAITEILTFGILFSLLTAIVMSIFTARRIIGPIQTMMLASHKIASGDYHERIPVSSLDELGALARSFNQMAEQLEQIEQRRLNLIGDVAHELRTPLSSIRSIMEGLVDDVLPSEPATFLSIQHEVSRLQRLVQDLEELSRAEAGQIALNFQSLEVKNLIQAAMDRLAPQYEEKGVELHLDLPTKLPEARADQARLTQVLLNLLGNALQYTPSGGQVTISAWQDGQEIIVEVRDTGIGIPVEHLPHLFERFYRVDKSRSRAGGGSGVGLTIAKHLIQAQGGRIWAESPGVNQGSTFTFTLPLAR